MRIDRRGLIAGITLGMLLAGTLTAPANATHRGCPAGTLDPAGLVAAVGEVPDRELTTTSVQLKVTTPEGCWRGAFGVRDLRSATPVPADARIRIGSVTKVFTAVVVYQLVAEGQLDLDEPVRPHLPDLIPADWPTITVRQLLAHTSGLPSPVLPDGLDWQLAHRYDRWTPEQIVRTALTNPPEYAPGSAQRYTNMGYIVAGILIERVTGTSYPEQMRQRIFRPLGLRDTYAPGTATGIRGPHVRGYQQVASDGRTELIDATRWSQTFTPASGDLVSTLADLDRFAAALFDGRLLAPAQQRELFTHPWAGAGYSNGGLSSVRLPDGRTFWGKSGARYGYQALVGALDDGSTRLAFAATPTDAKADGQSALAQRVFAAVLALA
ncbi:D-alanyl-D-alanine carboxypeptidase [Micromonospora phaseoli]|uniref:D-alanyl-D-alanine carboxypeptidase n=1 Tax=Micromonospora phaseoli TaxID=1144548 RepID=A0A1H7BL48_9ACTN|nr:serine hydrolase domain-containing protein [Micromonospora phaseoli]PZV94919.1 D-alanyl-D-alanine carboxypeptidase [Micromonospora phaseoli]GIJ79764.1 peptidase [Micromonospora phaseoli]SEJ77634.1 D-alanyl-D-alanine carboxypeptidase [Micromonospora phaseoli]